MPSSDRSPRSLCQTVEALDMRTIFWIAVSLMGQHLTWLWQQLNPPERRMLKSSLSAAISSWRMALPGDGTAVLYIPDVRARSRSNAMFLANQRSSFFVPKSGPSVPASTTMVSSIYPTMARHGSTCWKRGQFKTLGQEEPMARPNDLVVDAKGGVFYTLTRQNQGDLYFPSWRSPSCH